MDVYEDDTAENSPLVTSPSQFVFSVYRENPSGQATELKRLDSNKACGMCKCRSCRKLLDNPTFTCANCVNVGEFCASNHHTCSHKKREFLLKLLNRKDIEEFQQYSNNKSYHLTCGDRMFLLKKFRAEKATLDIEFQAKAQHAIEIRQMDEAIQVRKSRLLLMRDKIRILGERIEQNEKRNAQASQRIEAVRQRIEMHKSALAEARADMQAANDKTRCMVHTLRKQNGQLEKIRRECFSDLSQFIFPLEKIAAIEDDMAIRMENLRNAQLPAGDDVDDEGEEEEAVNVADYQYRIVQSCLPRDGDYKIASLLSMVSVDIDVNNPDSPRVSMAHDFYHILSGLCHACQLINVIAFYLHIHLPFRLHQGQFSSDTLTHDCLRANIAKLNANIVSSCLSQGIPIEFTDVTCTLENLSKLLFLDKYPSRSRPVVLAQSYIDMIERDVNEVGRTVINEYWFDDDVDRDDTDLLNSEEWEAVPDGGYIPSDQSFSDQSDSLPSTSSQQHSSLMSSSFGFLRYRGSFLFDSLVRNLRP